MPIRRTYQTGPRSVVALWVAVLVAGSCSTAALAFTGAAQSVKLAGTWSGSYTGGYSGTFTLHWTQSRSRLKGTIALSNPHGTYNITGSVNGTGIKFGAVGVGALYRARCRHQACRCPAHGRAARPRVGGRRTSS